MNSVYYQEDPPSKIELRKIKHTMLILGILSAFININWWFIMFLEWESNGYISGKGLFLSAQVVIVTITILCLYIIPKMQYIKMMKNYIVVTQKEFRVGNNMIPISQVKKVLIDPNRYWMYVYLKSGKILRFRKSTLSMMLLQFQKCMDTLGIEFGIIRRTGKWWKSKEKVIRIKAIEDYCKAKHKERYKRWLEKEGKRNCK